MSLPTPFEDIFLDIMGDSVSVIENEYAQSNTLDLYITETPTLAGSVPAIQEITVDYTGPAIIVNQASADKSVEITQSTPASTWTIQLVGFNRRPCVTVYIDGEEVDADVFATSTQVVVSFNTPRPGSIVLT